MTRLAKRRFEENIANARVPPQDNQTTPLEQAPQGDNATVNPPTIIYGEIRTTFINFA